MDGGSRYIRYIERREAKQKPRPGLWAAVTAIYLVFGIAFLVSFSVLRSVHGGHQDWGLLVLGIVWIAITPIGLWRRRRDQRRQPTWVKPTSGR
jgi:Flp pilus assembly protein TadB